MGLDCCALITLEDDREIEVVLDRYYVFEEIFDETTEHEEFGEPKTFKDFIEWIDKRNEILDIIDKDELTGGKRYHKHWIQFLWRKIESIEDKIIEIGIFHEQHPRIENKFL